MTGSDTSPVRVVVLGGGTAGWMSAAGLARMLPGVAAVTLVESEDIGIVGVGEATLPHLRGFVETLGIDEAAFMKATHATYKLGIDFRDFGSIGTSYIHPFGSFGEPAQGVGFQHWWLEMARRGLARPLGDYSLAVRAAQENRFRPPQAGQGLASTYGYAYQFDATLFGPFMREFGIAHGVTRIEGKVVSVERCPHSGDVRALVLSDGRRIEGELFVDCSGFRSMLLGEALGEEWEDWTHWLPCDRAAALPCSHAEGAPLRPYTTATAMPAGWRWQIPLQHRMGNGYVFSSAHLAEDAACEAILAAAEGTPLADPRILRFRPGRRRSSWSHNVVAVGLASGFLEPLESTSIYLAQIAITHLIDLFPAGGGCDPRDRAEFNRLVDMEYDRIRDFLILHYNATTRDDSAFWDHVRTMTVPDSLANKLELWRETAQVEIYREGLFYGASWVAVLIGQGVLPRRHDARTGLADPEAVARAMAALRHAIEAEVSAMPEHARYLAANGARLAQGIAQ